MALEDEITNISKRVKRGGILIRCYMFHPNSRQRAKDLRIPGFTKIMTEFIDRSSNTRGEFETVSDYYQVS
ncbi:MAG: hypothetical protein WC796_05900 [Candidatus Pacearchaeota archaeon]|jgi:hypothetical protein